LIRLGEDRRLGRAVCLGFDVAKHREDNLSGFEIGRCRFVDELDDEGFALGDLFASPVLDDDNRTVQRIAQQGRMFFLPRGRPFGLPDRPFWKRVCKGGLQ
jgi:hypothetical protein